MATWCPEALGIEVQVVASHFFPAACSHPIGVVHRMAPQRGSGDTRRVGAMHVHGARRQV